MSALERELAANTIHAGEAGEGAGPTAAEISAVESRIGLLEADWKWACVRYTDRLIDDIDGLTSCSTAFVDGLPARLLDPDMHDQLVTWFATEFDIDVSVLQPDAPEQPSPADIKLDELYRLAYETPGLPDAVADAYHEEYQWLLMLSMAVSSGGYAEEQLRGAQDAYLAGAPQQYCQDLLWGLDGFSAFIGPPAENQSNVFVALNYDIRRYVGLAIAQGRELGLS